jgi:hypothetical protein
MGEVREDFTAMSFSGRIGLFLLFLSLIALFIFFVSDWSGSTQFSFFCWGMPGLLLSILLIARGRQPPQPSGRFRILRQKREKKEGDEE